MSDRPSDAQLEELRKALPRLLGNLDDCSFDAMREHLAWTIVHHEGGEVLFREGDKSDALYLLLNGRMQASVVSPEGQPVPVGEIGRGESVGEMGVFTGDSRRATVTALRDSVLARIEVEVFHRILHACPAMMLNLARIIIERLQRQNSSRKPRPRKGNFAVLSVSPGWSVHPLIEALLRQFESPQQSVLRVNSKMVDQAAGSVGASQVTDAEREAHQWLVNYLDDLESRHDYVFYEADAAPTPWTQRCLRQADEVLLVARPDAPPELSAGEASFLHGPQRLTRVRQTLVMLHPAEATVAKNTTAFLQVRPEVKRHHQLRSGVEQDVARLARALTGKSIGLVMSGGGARGLAHIGVVRALQEAGVPIDSMGGTSIGSVLGACVAGDWGWQRMFDTFRSVILVNPTSDFNFLPLVSLLAGRKMRRVLENAFGDMLIEDLWLPYFCVSSNYTQVREHLHTRGSLCRSLEASVAIPGVFPPVVHGNDLLLDGGVFNNLPVDVMARTGVETILAVDLRSDEKQQPLAFEQIPGTWPLLADRFRRAETRRYPLPSVLTTLIAITTLSSDQKTSQMRLDVDLLFKPDVRGYGMLDWKFYDQIVEIGYRHAQEVLEKQPGLWSMGR